MKSLPHAAPASPRIRRWRVPPPLTRGTELLEGAEVLQELSGATAVLLWKSLRSITLWASANPREQAELFAEGAQQRRVAEILTAELDADLVEPLHVFADVLGTPARVRRETVALACRQVARWALAREHAATALAFVQAAALVCPGDAELAHEVGQLARSRDEHARAESWHRRAIMLGRQTGSWEIYARSYIGLGNLAVQRGNLPLARRCHTKAFRAARRHGLEGIQAMALHDLFSIAVEGEDARTAQRYAAQAFRAYGSEHPRVPYLAHDLCALWLREGRFAQALRVLRALTPHFQRDDERVLVLANVARAAGGVGDSETFETAWSDVRRIVLASRDGGRAAQAMLNIARGATGLGEWDRAEVAAQHALDIATRRGEAQIVFEAEAIRDSVAGHRRIEVAMDLEPVETETSQIVEDLIQALTPAGTGSA